MNSSSIVSESRDGVQYHVNDRNSRRKAMENHRTPSGKNVLQSLSNYLFMAPKRYAYNVENTYPNSTRKSNGPSQRGVQRSASLDRDDELLPFPQRQSSTSIRNSNSHRRSAVAEAAPPTQILVNIDEPMMPTERLHRSVGDLDLDRGYFDDISESDDDDVVENIVPPSVFSRQYGASNRRSSTPVAPVVLQSLPTIRVRAEDLYCLPCPDNTANSTPTNHTSDCSICCEAVTVYSTAVRLPCSHVYHPTCIDTWLRQNHTCPICRCTLPTLADFTTPRSILQRRHEEKLVAMSKGKEDGDGVHDLRPMQYTNSEVQGMSINDLKTIYTQWVTCTYHQTFMSLRIPDHVAEYNKEVLVAYLVLCNVIAVKADE